MKRWVYRRPIDFWRRKPLDVVLYPVSAAGPISATEPVVFSDSVDVLGRGIIETSSAVAFADSADITGKVYDNQTYH